MIGRVFGRYRIVQLLGEGGMGSVWKAEDAFLGRSVALKLLSPRLVDSDTARARFLREARATSALDHPGIGTVYDAGEQDGDAFIAMRLLDGGTVADRIKSEGPLEISEAVRIAAAAADALGHAHARGILHRDVSARNLMFATDGQVVVVDFGLARTEDQTGLTQSGAAVGTAHYMAPEIAHGKPADQRSDVYSLGAVLYEMLTGETPFTGERLQAVLYAAVNTPAPLPSEKRAEIPSQLDRIVLKALAKQPPDRFPTMEALRDDLQALEAYGLIAEAGLPTIRPRQAALRPLLVAGLAATLVALAAGGTWLWRKAAAAEAPKYTSLAVLPFRNTSANPGESEYLSEGLGQTLISKLTQISNLHVPPWNTVGRFRDPNAPVQKLASDLRVDALLFGTIAQDGQRIRGTVSIIDGKSGLQVWSESFDEPLADLFVVQNRIAMETATKLLGGLSGKQAETIAVPAAASVEAYEYYEKGTLALRRETQEDNESALTLFRRAIETDPRYAPAWSGIAVAHMNRYEFGWDGGLKDMAAAEEACIKALDLDPSLIPARRALMRVYWYRGSFEECLKQGKLVALSGASDTEATLARAEAYMFGGLSFRAVPLLRRVMTEEPANPAAAWLMVLACDWASNNLEGIETGQKFLTAFGDDTEVHFHMAIAYERLGKDQEAEAHYRRSIETETPGTMREVRLWFAWFLREHRRLDEADALVLETIDVVENKLLHNPDNCWLRDTLGAAYGLVGDLNRLREEESRIRADCGDAGLGTTAAVEGLVGDKARFLELSRAILRAGALYCRSESTPARAVWYRAPDLERQPGSKDLLDEQASECQRLAALY